MRNLHDSLRLHVAKKIQTALSSFELSPVPSLEELYNQLVEPPQPEMGDLAFGCFILSKTLKQSPAAVAQKLATSIPDCAEFSKVQALGPYLNFIFTEDFMGQNFLSLACNGQLFQQKLTHSNPKTMIEFSQPNTHKELHVGHMRNLCLGDAIVRLLRYANYPVITSTFPGDVGTHVAKCLWYLKFHNKEEIPNTGRGEWLGQIYSKAHLQLEDEVGTPQEAENRAQLTMILKQLEAHQGEYYDLWKETRQWSIELMKSTYAWAGVEFDQWYWESDVDAASVQFARQCFQEGKLIQSEGAIGMDLSADNLGFCLLLKSDGTGLYATKDVELARRKFQDHHIEKSLYVVDARQALHFKQVFRVLEILGFPQAKDCHHLQYNFVELPDGAMSSRKGNIVPIMKLVSAMETTIREQFLSRYAENWTEEELKKVAHQVAQGAIKYGMLRMDSNKKIVFDMKEWLRIDGESGPFIQYSHARIESLLRKLEYQSSEKVDWSLLSTVYEHRLIQHLMHFQNTVMLAAEGYKPSAVCTYLYETAKKFNLFYHECPIAGASSPELRNARLALSAATGAILRQGLGLLGIPAPERM